MKKKEKTKNKKSSVIWLMSVSFLAVGLLLFCQFYFGDNLSDKTVFYENTYINDVNVSGMTQKEAVSIVENKMLQKRKDVEITLTQGDNKWTLKGEDFEVKAAFDEPIKNALKYGHEGNVFTKKKIADKIKKEGLRLNISYRNILGGVDQKIDEVISQVEYEGSEDQIVFNPDDKTMFSVDGGKAGIKVEREKLLAKIDEAFETGVAQVEIPIVETVPTETKEDMLANIALRSKFKTSYATSSKDRKANVKKALEAFNGMIVAPDEEVSFNSTTGARTIENGYQTANIILNGVYVAGAGGGVCQASTTLYNALLLADVEVLEANHHTLPASYVPLSFDAMVSEGYSDLVFKNTLDCPIYIKTFCDESNVNVEIYGKPLDEGEEIKTRVEFVKIIPHDGDKIITDSTGEYSSKVLYKGEYYRLKYPREGYESKGYLQYYKDGQLVEEKEIRHDFYYPQSGLIVEGGEKLGEGMSIPPNDVKLIPAQKVTPATNEMVRAKIEKTNPSEFNP